MIDELTLFCGCYDLGSVATPEHATPTSVVLRAVDKRAANVGTAQEVAIKAMMNEEQFIRELMLRGDLDGEFVVPVNCSSNDFGTIQKKWSPGKITRDHGDGTYDVEYDDGHEERQVKADTGPLDSNAHSGSLQRQI